MKIFEIIDSFEPKTRWYLRAPRKFGGMEVHNWRSEAEPGREEVEGWHFTSGKKYEAAAPLVIPIYQGTVELDFTLGSMGMPVVKPHPAKRLKELCGDSVQWIPAVVPGIAERFEIANVLTLVDALDVDRSEVQWWTEKDNWPEKIGTIAGVARLVLRKDALVGVTMFRLNGWEPPLLISETL